MIPTTKEYRLYRTDIQAPEFLTSPIERIQTEVSTRPGVTTGTSTMIPSRPRSDFVNARYVRAALDGKIQDVPYRKVLDDRRGVGRDYCGQSIDGFYYFIGVVGRRENQRENYNLPDELFFMQTYGH